MTDFIMQSQPDTQEPGKEEEKGNVRMQYLTAISATIAYLITGSFMGWSSVTVPNLVDGSPFQISSSQGAWIISFVTVGCICTSVPSGYVSDLLGRKTILLVVVVPTAVSWIMAYFASSFAVVSVSRFIGGLGFGMACTTCPVYLGEIAEDSIRGSIGTIFQIMMNLGMLFEYSVGPYVSYKTLCLISLIFPVLLALLMVWMPESPYYLVAKGRRGDAEKVLMWLRGKKKPESVQKELDVIEMYVEVEANEKGSLRDLVSSRGNMKALSILVMLLLIQNFSGIIAMLSNVNFIFKQSGSSIDSDVSAIIFGSVQLLVSCFSSGIVDRAGRRPLLLLSSIGCAITLTCEGLYFFLSENDYETVIPIDWMPLLFLILYIIVYTLGLGPVPWAIASEIFPKNVKGLAVGIGGTVSPLAAIAATQIFQIVSDNYGLHTIFWIFAACCVLGTIYIAIFLPETKGKSLLQIYREINGVVSKEDGFADISNGAA